MTWTPKVGDWGVDANGVVVRYAGRFAGHELWESTDENMPDGQLVGLSSPLRPATIDEIPGSQATEEEHDAALADALGIVEDQAVRDVIVLWQRLEGEGRTR